MCKRRHGVCVIEEVPRLQSCDSEDEGDSNPGWSSDRPILFLFSLSNPENYACFIFMYFTLCIICTDSNQGSKLWPTLKYSSAFN